MTRWGNLLPKPLSDYPNLLILATEPSRWRGKPARSGGVLCNIARATEQHRGLLE